MPERPFSIKIFLPYGQPDGLRIVDKSNWTGRGVVFPRSLLPDIKKRDEFQETGVYVLVGPSEEGELPRIYIGEGDPVKGRLEQHFSKKDFWTWAMFFVSKDRSLNKAHVQHLEAQLVRIAREAKRSFFDNLNEPQNPSLSEAEVADVESFLEDMLSIFPLVGLSAFQRVESTNVGKHQLLTLESKGIKATGYESPEGFNIKEGSQAVKAEVPSIHHYMSVLRRELRETGVLTEKGDVLEFTQDYFFNSPSTAAGVALGRSANGRIEWKNSKGETLKQIQEKAAEGNGAA
ncbi:GIY-YIG domain nuclease, putative [Geotalea daltonii FRC-32]|uniref:GIY-YIG domain nuclease, putative n=1 Tax=Geotalea daltonii (strain DSM 22248 / JCM 15807 / FRC-32) TaxID=316067 RepID=B9M289_GEODF|nr:GIY-YIG nuclease family protein [Geotalea daltonii]ACM21207.1 GIY-YIG domain nuclease, putative [Geotalea daltonii FRC-32]